MIAIGVTTAKKIADRDQVDEPDLALVFDAGRGGSTQTPIEKTISRAEQVGEDEREAEPKLHAPREVGAGLVGRGISHASGIRPASGTVPSLVPWTRPS